MQDNTGESPGRFALVEIRQVKPEPNVARTDAIAPAMPGIGIESDRNRIGAAQLFSPLTVTSVLPFSAAKKTKGQQSAGPLITGDSRGTSHRERCPTQRVKPLLDIRRRVGSTEPFSPRQPARSG